MLNLLDSAPHHMSGQGCDDLNALNDVTSANDLM